GVLDPGEDVVNGVLDPTPSQLIVSGVTVEDGDLILVRFGAASDVSEDLNGNGLLDDTEDTNQNGVLDLGSSAQYPSAIPNGIYQVAIDETGATPWTLTRWTRPGENSPVEEAVVVVADGFYRTSETGQTFTVNYDGLGLSALTISDPVNNSAETVQLNLGSYDPRDSVDFVVSTNGNSNTSPGSLGRMLKLVQENQAKDFNQEFVEQAIRFGNVLGGFDGITGSIELQQELPAIERAFVLDASNRYPLTTDAILPIVIDGSRITSTREGTFVVDDEINGFVYKAGATGQTGSTSPEDATRSVLRGLQMGGFESGAAVQIDSVSNVLVEDMTIGLNAEKNSQAVKYGIQITGNETGQDGPVTLLNNNIYSASISGGISNPIIGAGILIESNPGASEPTDYVQVVGGLVGQSIGSNASGIEVRTHDNVGLEDTNGNGLLDVGEDTNGNGVLDTLDGRAGNMIGANPLPAMPNLAVVQNKATVELDTAMWGTYGNDLYLGQSVSSSAFLPGTVIAFIELGNSEDANGNGVLDTEDVNGNGTLDQGEDTNSNGRLDFEDINQNGAIDFSRNVTMSERATLTNNGGQEIQFGSGQANGSRVLISNNFTGIKLQSGKVRVVNTEVRDNVLNGIEVGQDTPPADASLLEARIGDGLSSPLIQRRLAETPTSQATTLKLESVLPIAVGMNVSDSGTAIQLGTTVINVNALQNEITLSKPIGSGLQLNDELQFEGLNPKIRSDASNAILSNGQYGIRFQDSVRFLYEDANGNNILDPNEDLNDNGKLDTALRFQGNYVGKVHQGSNEPGNLRA
ncbi:hypothetical protein N9A79_03145, partial [Pirellulales bacterium]|nr:hypothetical protein [Pirellulales bacterium]